MTPPKIRMILIMRIRKSELGKYSTILFVRYSPAASQFIQDLFGLAHVQVFVELTVDLDRRGRGAGSQAFELDCRKQTVSREFAQFYAEFAFHTRLDFI